MTCPADNFDDGIFKKARRFYTVYPAFFIRGFCKKNFILFIFLFDYSKLMKYLIIILAVFWAIPGFAQGKKVYTSIEEALAEKDEVTHLKLARKDWTVLPSDITLFKNLESLDLSRNPNLNLDNSIELLAELPNLKVLNLGWGNNRTLSDSIFKLQNLEVLNLRDNRLMALPDTFYSLQKLKVLNLRHNYHFDLENIFDQFEKMPLLEVLNLSYSQLHELPESVGKLNNLKVLDIEGNAITGLPQSFGKLESLRKLNWNKNIGYGEMTGIVPEVLKIKQIEAFPVLGKLPQLDTLLLNDNYLSFLAGEIQLLSNLKVLELDGNRLNALPEQIGKLKNLERLTAKNDMRMGRTTNEISSLPSTFKNLTNMRHLDLEGNLFVEWKTDLSGLDKLEHLDLSWNRLTKFPDAFRHLQNLRFLNLSVNLITELPDWIGELDRLEEFRMNGDFFLPPDYKLKALPTSFSNLTNLRVVTLQDQVIEALPEDIDNLSKLEILNIRNNLLGGLPETIGKLASLRKLDLKANEISTLPSSMGNLKQLTELNLSFNLPLRMTVEINKLVGAENLERLDISFTQPITSPQLKEMREKLEGVTIVYAYTDR